MQITGQITGGIWDKDDERVKRLIVDYYEKATGVKIPKGLSDLHIGESSDYGTRYVTIYDWTSTTGYEEWVVYDESIDSIVNHYILDLITFHL